MGNSIKIPTLNANTIEKITITRSVIKDNAIEKVLVREINDECGINEIIDKINNPNETINTAKYIIFDARNVSMECSDGTFIELQMGIDVIRPKCAASSLAETRLYENNEFAEYL